MNILKTKLSLTIKIPSNKENDNTLVTEMDIKDYKMQKSECNQIFENIFLSGYNLASDLDFLIKNKFTHIVNCAKSSKNFTAKNFDNFQYLNFTIEDDPGFSITESIKIFIDFIEKLNNTNPNRKILVHCFEGISRAPSLLAAYLIWKLKISKESALKIIRDKRPCIEINLGFLYQLEKWSYLCDLQNDYYKTNKIFLNKKRDLKIKNLCSDEDIKSHINNNSINYDQKDFFVHTKIRVNEENKEKENFITLIRLHNKPSNNDINNNNYQNEKKFSETKNFFDKKDVN